MIIMDSADDIVEKEIRNNDETWHIGVCLTPKSLVFQLIEDGIR